MIRGLARRALLVASVAIASTSATRTSAQPSDPQRTAAAQVLYDEGMTALEAKDFGKACPKFEEAMRLVPEGIGVKLMLAECYEGAGRLASAWALYKVVEQEASRAKQKERQAKAEKRVAALESTLARVTVEVAPDVRTAADLVVTRGGVQVGASQWGAAIPVDRGDVLVSAKSARGTFERTVTVEDGARVTIVVDALVPGQAPAPLVPQASESAQEPDRSSASALLVPGLVVGGVGVAFLAAGAGLGIQALIDSGEVEDRCPNDACSDREAVDLDERANLFSILGWVGLGVGAAAVGTGIALVVIPAPAPDAAAAGSAAVIVTPGGLSYRMEF